MDSGEDSASARWPFYSQSGDKRTIGKPLPISSLCAQPIRRDSSVSIEVEQWH
jgi:hypothetical protein